MIPRPLFFWIAAGLTCLGGLAIFAPQPGAYWLYLALALVVIAAIDAGLSYRTQVPVVTREMPSSLSLGSPTDIRLIVRHTGGGNSIRMLLFDHYPPSFKALGLPQELSVDAGRYGELEYSAQPGQRGAFRFTGCELRLCSPLGLWWRRAWLPLLTDVRVYPNYSTITKLLLHGVDNPLSQTGIRLRRRRGEGMEFHQLRDYREGDSLRVLDWKATARMSRMIAREYQDERDQQIIFVLDAGRRMLAKDAELSHFDHTLNAMLLLSYVALRQGDSVGVMTANDTRRWLPPRKGLAAINTILNHVYDTEPQPVEVDYLAAATELAILQRRRSLIIVLSNVREEDSDDLQAAFQLLRKRHLVMLASLRERVLDENLQIPVRSFAAALNYSATDRYLEARRESQNLLRASGVFVEDCLCDELPAAITNRYLAIKRAGML